MGIYQRDNINYGGMLGNAMQNRARQIERDYDNYMRQPMAWANAVNQAGQAVSNAFNQAAQYQYNKDQLAAQQQFQSEQNAMSRANQLQLQREREAEALKRAQEQQKWQAEQNDLNRANQIKMVELSNQKAANNTDESIIRARNQLNYDVAEAEYMDAVSKVDMSKPETVLAAKKAALKLNFNAQQLPYYDPKVHNVMTDFTEDAPGVARTKSIQSAKSRMDAIKKLKPNKWSDEQRQDYMDAYATLLELEPDSAKEYEVALLNKGKTSNQINTEINAAIDSAITSGDQSKLPGGYTVRSFSDGRYIAKKGSNGNWIKVKKWGK